ncbi:MAG: tetratricopeptide repeat protein [Saprospiraceae bacterium]|nr:tetratricopeptide repeat protein [Saprospiraceae bacterium]
MKNLIFAVILEKISLNMKKSLFVLCTFFIALSAINSQNLAEAITHLENENFTAALNTLNKLAQTDAKNPIYNYYIGEVYYAMENPLEARKAYDKGLIISSKCDECHIGLGRLDYDENRMEPAKKHFETALKGNSKNHHIHALVGMAYLYNKKPNPDIAINYLTKARDLDPKQAKYWIALGDANQIKGNLGDAMTAYETAVEKDKNKVETYVKMSRIWTAGKQTDLAIERLENAIKIKPDYAIAYKDLYELYIATRKFDKVVPILDKYVSLTGSDIDAKVRLVKFLAYQAKDYKRAIEEGSQLVILNPKQYTLHRWLAWSYFEISDYKNSLKSSFSLFEEIKKDTLNRKTYPSDIEYAAKAASKLNLMDTAELFYIQLMDLQPEKALDISSNLAKALYDGKRFDKAEKWYLLKEAKASLTNNELVYLGLSQKIQGKFLVADSTFGKILAASPKYDWGWYTRALINIELDPEKKLFLARPYFEKYIELASIDPVKNSAKLIEAYTYLAWYSVQIENIELAKSYCNMVLNLNPNDETAKTYLDILNKQSKNK